MEALMPITGTVSKSSIQESEVESAEMECKGRTELILNRTNNDCWVPIIYYLLPSIYCLVPDTWYLVLVPETHQRSL